MSEYEIYKKTGGYFELPKRFIRIAGPDAADFLHRVTTQNVKALFPGLGLQTALLQPTGMIVSYFDLYHSGNFFLAVTDEDHFQPTLDCLEKLHFSENLTITDVTSDFYFLSVQGEKVEVALKEAVGRVPEHEHEIMGTTDCFVANERDFFSQGFHLLVKRASVEDMKAKLKKAGLLPLSLSLWELLRAESGHFRFGVDVTEKNLILESALAGYVSRNKGCYPGQEVVERVFTYGNVSKKLVGIDLGDLAVDKSVPSKLLNDGKEVGVVTSIVSFPWSQKSFGFAMVRKPFYEDGQILNFKNMNVKVVKLPHSFDIQRELKKEI